MEELLSSRIFMRLENRYGKSINEVFFWKT